MSDSAATTNLPPNKEAQPPIAVKEPIKKEAEKPVVGTTDMAQYVAFSAVRNPLNPDRVFIYRVSPKEQSLSYEQRAIQKGISAPRWNKTIADKSGVPSTKIRADSNVVTLVYDDVVHVYGVCADVNLVTLLSPFVEPLEPQVNCTRGRIAGCSFTEHDEEQAWLVYEAKDGMTADAPAKLMYCDVTTPETPDSASTAKDVMTKTGLSLFHDTRRFWVVFQNKAGQLVAHNEKDQKPSVISADTSHFRTQTPIASCFIPAKEIDPARVPGFRSDALGRVIIYWVRDFNGKPCLYRSHADLTERSSSADFSEPRQATENGVAVEPLAQIAVVTNPENQSNYLFVAKRGGDNISSVTDDWATSNETQNSLDMVNTELFKKWQAKILEEAILGRRYDIGHGGFNDKAHHHHHPPNGLDHNHGYNRYPSGYTNGTRLLDEESTEGDILESDDMKRITNGTKNLPLVWRNKGDATKPQVHSGVFKRSAASKWAEAEVQVTLPAGSTIMGDIMIQLKVRPTD